MTETYGIEKLGIIGPKAVYRNLTPAQLTEALCAGAREPSAIQARWW